MTSCSEAPGPAPLDRASARACLWTNLLVLPGLGSLVAGQRVGWAQVTLALAGLGAFLWGLVRLVRDWLASEGLGFEFTRGLGAMAIGLGISGVAWLWALGTSVQVLRAARARERALAAGQEQATGRPGVSAQAPAERSEG